MILPADTSIKELSSTALNLLIEEATAELKARRKARVETEMTMLWKAIENFQKNGFEKCYLGTTDGLAIDVSTIGEIYNETFDCGFTFGPWEEEDWKFRISTLTL